MKATFECIPCIVRQTIDAVREGVTDPDLQRTAINKTLKFLQEADLELSPPELGKSIYKIVTETVGKTDLYGEHKFRINQFILNNYSMLKRIVYLSDDPVYLAAKLYMLLPFIYN